MPLDERMLAQNDTIADLQRSITATLTYLMGRASVAELFGLQGYLSQLASRMTDPGAGAEGYALRHDMPAVLRQQMARDGAPAQAACGPCRSRRTLRQRRIARRVSLCRETLCRACIMNGSSRIA